MAEPCRLLLRVVAIVSLAGLGAEAARVREPRSVKAKVPPDWELLPGESELVFIRHGVSLNNVFKGYFSKNLWAIAKLKGYSWYDSDFEKSWKTTSESEFKSGYQVACHQQNLCGDYASSNSSLAWEIVRMSRDCLLHPSKGEDAALELQKKLAGILPKNAFDGVFVSPLRRTLETSLATIGQWMNGTNTMVFPWIHETYNSVSDLANDGDMNSKFLQRYQSHLERQAQNFSLKLDISAPVHALQKGLEILGKDWVEKAGTSLVGAQQPEPPVSDDEAGAFPYYPNNGWTNSETSTQFQTRLHIAKRLLTKLPPGRYAFVSHGQVGKNLFGRKPKNLAVITARYFNVKDVEAADFFHDVQLARDRWQVDGLPGWID